MRVNPQRHLDPLVAEPLLHDVRCDAGLEQKCRARMPEAVKGDPPDTRGGDQPRELPLAEVVRLSSAAARRRTER